MSVQARSEMGAAELRLSRGLMAGVGTRTVAFGVTALAIVAMVVDHLVGSDPGLEDPPMFLIGSAVAVGLAAIVFGRVVPGAIGAEAASKRGLILSVLSVIPGIMLVWIAVPFALAGGGVALGLIARERGAGHRATAAIALGALALLVATTYYVVEAADKL